MIVDVSPDGGKIKIRPLEIRQLEAGDLDAVLGIAAVFTQEAPHWSRNQYDEILRGHSVIPRIALAAEDAQSREVVGFVIASLVPPEAELEFIAVASDCLRRAIGSRLLAALVHHLKSAGVSELRLEVRASNLRAVRFYELKNFKQIGVRQAYYVDPEEDAVIMVRRVSLD